jgi:hypothetical protein
MVTTTTLTSMGAGVAASVAAWTEVSPVVSRRRQSGRVNHGLAEIATARRQR